MQHVHAAIDRHAAADERHRGHHRLVTSAHYAEARDIQPAAPTVAEHAR